MSERRNLPGRRPMETLRLEIGGAQALASIGYDPQTGYPLEVFLAGEKVGTDLWNVLHDTAVIISVALQYGVPAEVLAKSIARETERETLTMTDKPATIIGAVLDAIARRSHLTEVGDC
jgi:ribonucleoside-diphosphate reductase alpha chain